MKKKSYFYFFVRIFIALAILSYFLNKIPLSEIIALIVSAKSGYILLVCLLAILLQMITARRLELLVNQQGLRLSFYRALEINLSSCFYGLFLPGGKLAGGAVRFYQLSKPDKKNAEAMAVLAIDRIVATIALCVIGIPFWLIDLPHNERWAGFGMFFALGMLIIFFIMLINKKALRPIQNLCNLANMNVISTKIDSLSLSLNKYRYMSFSMLAYIFGLSLTAHILTALCYYFCAQALSIEISFLSIGWIRSIVGLITLIPISASGLGIREGALLFFLRPYGVSAQETIALSFLAFGISVLFMALLGGLIEVRKLFLSNTEGR